MNLVNQSAFLKALGWSLLDSLWQLGILWLLYVVLTANGKKFTARQRHTLALLSLAGGSAWFLITLVINFYNAAATPTIITLLVQAGELIHLPATKGNFSTLMEQMLPFLSVAYLLVAMLLFVRFYRQYHFTRRLFTQGLQKINPEWRVFVQETVLHMSIPRKVSIWLSSRVDTPLTIGFWKPIILLPVAAVNNLSIEQTEAIILHELHHIKRNDYLVNLLIASTDIIFFFNPFARLLAGNMRREREHSCDDMVLQFRYDATQYARALLTLEQNRSSLTPALAVAATGKSNNLLLNRVKRMLTNEPAANAVSQKLAAWLVSAFLIGFIGWYNPGKAIVTQIEEIAIKTPQTTSVEFASNISTPPAAPAVADQSLEPAAPLTDDQRPCTGEEESTEDDTDGEALLSDRDLAALQLEMSLFAAQQQQAAQQMVKLVASTEMRDYSLQVTQEAIAAVGPVLNHPYIPGNSFLVQIIEDTLRPKQYVMSQSEKEAKEAMDKAMKALEQVDWQKIEKELKNATGQIDGQQLQQEIIKAIKRVDWKKISQDTEKALQLSSRQLAEEQAMLKAKLEQYGRQRQEKQEKLRQLQQQVVLDRLQQNEKSNNCEQSGTTDAEQKITRKKKIIVI
ncbi:M56 family metallopeptidase [Paraflavitalea pollutisoli]|uniref:M56 family metallopeptidase n=1 Tax=Paraflavitalea pollutisoli TaxID=3034143 RepID=UPI0023EAA74C|nr:M56 family metallopeptidase [Paraflavitalea sp. H1-2-19X]